MLRFLFISLFILQYFVSKAQNSIPYHPEKVFLPEKIAKDIDLLQGFLYDYHPNIFRYTTKNTFDMAFQNLKSNLRVMNERQIRIALRKIVAKIGCGHTNIIPSQLFIKYYTKNDYSNLPLEVQIFNDKLLISNNLSSDSSIVLGSELLSVNGWQSNDLVQHILDMEGSDGLNHSYKSYEIAQNFRYFCSLLFGMHNSFFVEIKDSTQTIKMMQLFEKEEDSIVTIQKNKPQEITKQALKQANATINQPASWAIEQKYKKLKIDTTNSLAIFRIDEFEGKKYKKFYTKIFKTLHEQKIDKLVIDLRGNGGGKMFDACNLLTYLLKEPFSYEFKRKNIKVRFRKYMTDSKFLIGLMPLAFRFVAKKIIRNDSTIYIVSDKPQQKYIFKGEIFVLTDGGTFSAASFVASYLKQLSKATLIGTETGGSESGTNAMLFAFLTLPETQIILRLPLYRINHILPLQDIGNGVMPSFTVNYTIQEIIDKQDKEIEKVYELLRIKQ